MSIKLKNNLTRILSERRLTLAALAKKSGVPRSSIHNWTSAAGQEKINIRHVQKLARALEIPLHQLLFSEPDPFEKREIFSGDLRVSIHKIERNRK